MNELQNIPWTKVFSNFIWILGFSIILAAFSYHEFLAQEKKIRRKEALQMASFKKPFLIGLILILVGVNASVDILGLNVFLDIFVLFLVIRLIKIFKNKDAPKKGL